RHWNATTLITCKMILSPNCERRPSEHSWHHCARGYWACGVDLDLEDGMSSGRFMTPVGKGETMETETSWTPINGKGGLNMVSDGLNFFCGDVLEVLKPLPGNSVKTCIPPPPYW